MDITKFVIDLSINPAIDYTLSSRVEFAHLYEVYAVL